MEQYRVELDAMFARDGLTVPFAFVAEAAYGLAHLVSWSGVG